MGRPQNIDRNLVLDAAEAIVLERGAAELTIDAVAQSVGITKGGVQYCFGTKAGLIDAMVDRWCREFQAEIDTLTSPTDDPIAAIGGYVEATAKINKLSHARAAGMMAVLLQSPEHMQGVRRWYREHLQPLDLSTPEGKKARIAFMAMEGAFLLRSFGFMQMSDGDWGELFGEIKATLPAMPSQAKSGSKPPQRPTATPPTKRLTDSPIKHQSPSTTEHQPATGNEGNSHASREIRALVTSDNERIRQQQADTQTAEPLENTSAADDDLPFFLF